MRYLFLILFTFAMLNANGGVLEVDWTTISKGQQKLSTPYPKLLTEGIANTHLPVYLSSNVLYDKSMVVVADKNFYSISFEIEGATVLFEGDKTFQESVSSSNPEFQKIAQTTKSVEYNEAEGVMSAEFNKHGVNYAISIECSNPKTDKRCTQEEYVQSLYKRLVMVGGRP